MRASKKKQKRLSEEGRIKLAETLRRRWSDPIERAKMLASRKDRKDRKPISEETRAKMAEARRTWWTTHDTTETRRKIKENHARPTKGKMGPLHPSWKGGRYTNKRDKYVYVYAPGHPNCVKATNGVGGYVLEHRLVMEKLLGRYLHPDEDVNHRNGIKDDNRPDNLILVSHFAHFEEHGCLSCGFKFLTK